MVSLALIRSLRRNGLTVRRVEYSAGRIGTFISRHSDSLPPHIRYLLNVAAFCDGFAPRNLNGIDFVVADRYVQSVQAYYRAAPARDRLVDEVPLQAQPCVINVLLDCPPKLRLARILARDGDISERKRSTVGGYGERILGHLKAQNQWFVLRSDIATPSECAERIVQSISNVLPDERSIE